MRISGGFKPINSSFIRFSAKEALAITWVTASGSLGTRDIGLAINYQVSATTNNTTTITYAVVAGSLPDGVSLNAMTGQITGIPSSVGMYAFTIRAAAGRVTKDQSFAITTNAVTLAWTTASGTLGTLNGGHAVPTRSVVATASNGQPVTYSLLSGTLPPGVSLSASGALSGTTDNSGSFSYSFTIRADYAGILHSDRAFSYDVVQDAITWTTPASLGSLKGGKAANITLLAVDSAGDGVTYSLRSGTLPAGLSLVGNKITGTAQNLNGSSSFTIRASDAVTFADQTFTLSVALDTVTWTTAGALGTFGGGAAFSKALAATSSNGDPVVYTIQSGTTPGLTISGGSLTGTLSNVSTDFTFVIRASDGVAFADLTVTMTVISEAISWTTPVLPLAAANVAYTQSLTATSSTGATVTYAVVSGALPQGLTLSGAGVISGAYTGTTNTTASTTIRATGAGAYADLSISIPVHSAPIWTNSGSLGTIVLGQTFSYNFSVTDSVPVISYALAPNSAALPNTTKLTTNTVTNTATLSGYFNNPNGPVFTTAAGSLGTSFRQDTVSYQVRANVQGTATSITGYSIVGDPATSTLPAGLTMAGNGAITGTADLYSKDLLETPVSRYTAPLWTTNSNLGVIYIGNTISLPIQAIGQNGNASTLTYAMTSLDVLPFGIQLGLNGTISGSIDKTAVSQETPMSAPAPVWGTAPGTLGTLTNSPAAPGISLTLRSTPIFGNAITSYAVIANTGLTVANGVMTVSGVLPDGITLTQAGVLSGSAVPTTSFGESPNAAILPAPAWTTAAGSLGSSTNGRAISLALAATPTPNTSVTFHVSDGGLPRGVSLVTANAVLGTATLSGTLDANGTTASGTVAGSAAAGSNTLSNAQTVNFTIRALSNTGGYADQAFAYTITATP